MIGAYLGFGSHLLACSVYPDVLCQHVVVSNLRQELVVIKVPKMFDRLSHFLCIRR